MAHINIQPPGVVPLQDGDRKPIIRVIGGDTWVVSANLVNPVNPGEPATPENTLIRIALSETQFCDPIWAGGWYTGVFPDTTRRDLCWIRIPRDVTKALRRGSYMFSLRVSDLLQTSVATELQGSFLVEYTPTSGQHSIPYKDGTMEQDEAKTLELVKDIEAEFNAFKEKFNFENVKLLLTSDTLGTTKTEFNKLLEILKAVNK